MSVSVSVLVCVCVCVCVSLHSQWRVRSEKTTTIDSVSFYLLYLKRFPVTPSHEYENAKPRKRAKTSDLCNYIINNSKAFSIELIAN